MINDLARQSLDGSSEGETMVADLIQTETMEPEDPAEWKRHADELLSASNGLIVGERPAELAAADTWISIAPQNRSSDDEDANAAIDRVLTSEVDCLW